MSHITAGQNARWNGQQTVAKLYKYYAVKYSIGPRNESVAAKRIELFF